MLDLELMDFDTARVALLAPVDGCSHRKQKGSHAEPFTTAGGGAAGNVQLRYGGARAVKGRDKSKRRKVSNRPFGGQDPVAGELLWLLYRAGYTGEFD